MRLILSLLVIAVILSSCAPRSDSPRLPPSISSEQKTEIDQLINEAIHDGPLASLSIGFQFGAEPSLVEGYGLTNIAANENAGSASVYQIGSLTKTFTAAAIMRLVEEGKINLDNSITTYIEELPSEAEGISVRSLLAHTSGLPNLEETGIDIDYSRTYAPNEVIDIVSDDFPRSKFPPGTGFHYSNLGYFLLGYIIEEAAETSYYAYVQSELLDPLGLKGTGECGSYRGQVAQGYKVSGQDLVPAEPSNLSLAYAAGGLCSNAEDLIRWFGSLSSGDIVDRNAFKEMTTQVVLSNGTTLQSGLGFMVGDFLGAEAIGHIGRTSGYESFMILFPGDDLAIVVLCNTSPSDPYEISNLISSIREVVSG
jgi:CubicO group peptidase (beta-lactamase class C family)